MNDIWDVIGELGMEIHPDRISAIASRIASLKSVADFESSRISSGLGIDKSLVDCLHKIWKDHPQLTPPEIAAAMRGASRTAALVENREAVEIVWTGPISPMVASRHTEQVLFEIISSSLLRLFIVSFIAYDIDTVTAALQEAINRNVHIDILIASSRKQGGKVSIDSVRTFQTKVPKANIYLWNKSKSSSDKLAGVVHAKCAVADGSLAYITSANLTNAAMEQNMELGVLIRGGRIPEKLLQHLDALVMTGVIIKV